MLYFGMEPHRRVISTLFLPFRGVIFPSSVKEGGGGRAGRGGAGRPPLSEYFGLRIERAARCAACRSPEGGRPVLPSACVRTLPAARPAVGGMNIGDGAFSIWSRGCACDEFSAELRRVAARRFAPKPTTRHCCASLSLSALLHGTARTSAATVLPRDSSLHNHEADATTHKRKERNHE